MEDLNEQLHNEEEQELLTEEVQEVCEDMGLVSVIVPVYNIEEYLRPCIESVLNQTYPYFELLLVDDGSTDTSPAICDEYAQQDSRVRVIHKENTGVSRTRNRGIDEAKGEFIVFVDSDDLIGEKMLEKMIRAITRYQTDLAISGYERFRDTWKQRSRLSPYSLVIFQSLAELSSVYTKAATNMFGVSIWAKMYRTQIIREHNIRFREDMNYEEDCVFNLAYFAHVTTTAVLRDYFYSYRQMDVSLSKGYRKNSFQFLVDGYNARRSFLEEQKLGVKGADGIFLIVVKTTLMKIFNSDLPQEEKVEEYDKIAAFEESRRVCEAAVKSKVRLTRKLSQAVLTGDGKKIASVLKLWKFIDKSKQRVKKLIWIAKKPLRVLKKLLKH